MRGPVASSQNRYMMISARSWDWRLAAACRHADPELFFPVGTTGPSASQIAQAKEVCRTCPVRTACLGWALQSGIDYGIWGGTTETERRALRMATAGQRRPA
jgi:WhiB family transcriptional regulator, redox-sensing transcriptional regulator